MKGDSYIHGTTLEEQNRLSLLNSLLNDSCIKELQLQKGNRVIDVGSGLGQFSRLMAREVGPEGHILGVEQNADQLNLAKKLAQEAGEENLIETRKGDAHSLPLREGEWGSFDVAHTRFLLEHVNDPLAVVRMMVQAVKTGGRIVLLDDDHDVLRLMPEPEGFGALWHAYARTYQQMGNDPYVGRRLVALLHDSGATPTRNNWLFFGSCAGNPSFFGYVENLITVLLTARGKVLTHGLIDGAFFDRAIKELHHWKHRSDAAIWYAVCYAEGIRKN